ncbi:hypothetical protein DKX38_018358 [Salix brachista]|uniref:Uncharacterized protein n=1 Tax=Salix brachista TaxID=2182728 RepID=A0A5N5KND7_9ROSI|nr:hypothetical protein DKX38_018358 [Salix brachista]
MSDPKYAYPYPAQVCLSIPCSRLLSGTSSDGTSAILRCSATSERAWIPRGMVILLETSLQLCAAAALLTSAAATPPSSVSS